MTDKCSLACHIFGHKFGKYNSSTYWHYYCTRPGCTIGTDKREQADMMWKETFWESDAWQAIKGISIALAIIAVVLFIIFYTQNSACMKYQEFGIEVVYNWLTGCMAKHSEFGWVPIDKYFEIITLLVK